MKTKIIIGSVLIAALALGVPTESMARWDISIHIPLPGLYYYVPQLAPAPGIYGYTATAAGPLFYGGYWYQPSGGRWYVAAQAAGPWYFIGVESVPMAVMRAPVYHEGGRGHDGRYVPPRLYYDEDGRHHHRRGHDD